MRYVMARYVEYQKEMAYRYYLCDAVNLINQKKYMQHRFVELDSNNIRKEEEVTGDDIVADIISRAGLVVNYEFV